MPGTVRTVPGRIRPGSGPITRRFAAYRACQPPRTPSAAAMADKVSPGATAYLAVVGRPGSVRIVPGRIRPGSGPMSRRLAAYSSCHPPRTLSAVAMPDRVSPGRTVQVATGWAAACTALTVMKLAGALAGTAWVVLLAMLMPAWAA